MTLSMCAVGLCFADGSYDLFHADVAADGTAEEIFALQEQLGGSDVSLGTKHKGKTLIAYFACGENDVDYVEIQDSVVVWRGAGYPIDEATNPEWNEVNIPINENMKLFALTQAS